MKYGNVSRPIGLNAACGEIEAVCRSAHLYRHGMKPRHLIVPLDAGCGRTTLVEYMAEMYKGNGVLPFASSREDYVEVTLDAETPQKLRQGLNRFRLAADYSNTFENIGAMDISDVARHMGEAQLGEFLDGCKEICQDACMVFFLHSQPTPNEERLVQKLCDRVGSRFFQRIPPEAYTSRELAQLMEKALGEFGIRTEDSESFRDVLTEMAENLSIATVQDALSAAEQLVSLADYSVCPPVIRTEAAAAAVPSRAMEKRWEDAK